MEKHINPSRFVDVTDRELTQLLEKNGFVRHLINRERDALINNLAYSFLCSHILLPGLVLGNISF